MVAIDALYDVMSMLEMAICIWHL